MLGAIIGDIVGSRFEFKNLRSKDFELFTEKNGVTDDSIMTLAVADAMMKTVEDKNATEPFDDRLEKAVVTSMREIGRRYPFCGFGGMFFRWVFSPDPKPYNSFGNGAAMRISPVGFVAKSEEEAVRMSKIVTSVTHNHKEGVKGAEATVIAIYMARHGYDKEKIRDRIQQEYYDLDFTIDGIRDGYEFNETCQNTVPQAIEAFLESVSFEDAIRTAVSVGGDSDTLAAITGGIAQAYYGVPKDMEEKALRYLDPFLRSIYGRWIDFIHP